MQIWKSKIVSPFWYTMNFVNYPYEKYTLYSCIFFRCLNSNIAKRSGETKQIKVEMIPIVPLCSFRFHCIWIYKRTAIDTIINQSIVLIFINALWIYYQSYTWLQSCNLIGEWFSSCCAKTTTGRFRSALSNIGSCPGLNHFF
jgi:hypothetical protein